MAWVLVSILLVSSSAFSNALPIILISEIQTSSEFYSIERLIDTLVIFDADPNIDINSADFNADLTAATGATFWAQTEVSFSFDFLASLNVEQFIRKGLLFVDRL